MTLSRIVDKYPEFNETQDFFWFKNELRCWCQFSLKVFRLSLTLGRVRKKNDGRWEWTFWPKPHYFNSKFNYHNSLQGVCDTQESAMEKVESFYLEEIQKCLQLN